MGSPRIFKGPERLYNWKITHLKIPWTKCQKREEGLVAASCLARIMDASKLNALHSARSSKQCSEMRVLKKGGFFWGVPTDYGSTILEQGLLAMVSYLWIPI